MRKHTLLPHQEEALDYCRKRNHVALFLEMRLGKTLVLIRWAQEVVPRGLCLVVAPKTVLASWCNELRSENELYHLMEESSSERRMQVVLETLEKNPKSRVWFLMSYGMLRHTPKLATHPVPWQLVCLDESTCIKNPKAQTSKLVCEGFRHVPHRAILSGMPWPENTLELFQQMRFLWGGFMSCESYWEFRARYYNSPWDRWGDWVLKREVWDHLKSVVHKRCFIRTRKQVNLLKHKVYRQRVVTFPLEIQELYSNVEASWSLNDSETKWAVVVHNWLSRLTGGFDHELKLVSRHKVRELMRLLQEEFAEDKVVVWARYTAEIELIQECLDNAGIPCLVLTGKTGGGIDQRRELLDQFRTQERCVLVCQQALARYGIDVASADTAIYYSNYYSFEMRTQSEDRIIHPLKQTPLLYVDLVTENTIDEDVVEILQTKKLRAVGFMRLLRRELMKKRGAT